MQAAKRGVFPPDLRDLEICAATGWSFTELKAQEDVDVERMLVYVSTVAERQRRDSEDARREVERGLSRIR